jgi:hypothetical protein
VSYMVRYLLERAVLPFGCVSRVDQVTMIGILEYN